MNLWGSVCYLLKLHPLWMSNLAPSDTLSPPPCGWMHFKEPRWTREPGPARLVEPMGKKLTILLAKWVLQRYRSGDSRRLPPIWLGFKFRRPWHVWPTQSNVYNVFFIIDWYFRSVSEKWIRILKIISQRNYSFIFLKLLTSFTWKLGPPSKIMLVFEADNNTSFSFQTLRTFFSKLEKNSVN